MKVNKRHQYGRFPSKCVEGAIRRDDKQQMWASLARPKSLVCVQPAAVSNFPPTWCQKWDC